MAVDRLVGVLERIATALEAIAGGQMPQNGGICDHADLVAALADFFGGSPFTAAGVLTAANEDGRLFDALLDVVDLDGDRPAIVLGRILNRLPQLERLPGRIALYRLHR